jgi:mannan endo-1,4-beta-mannosidase
MRIHLFFLLFFMTINAPLFSQTMFVEGRYLYSAAREKVVLRGINEMAIWDKTDQTLKETLPEMAKTGSNSARLCWLTTGSPQNLDLLLTNCISNKMIPIIELHDATGDWSKFQLLLDYWKNPEVIKVMQKHKKWVLLNIGNEVGTETTNADFFARYKDAVLRLRKVGYEMPIIIDAANWGRDEQNLTENFHELINIDPKKNLIFSVHLYWKENTMKELTDRFDRLTEKVISGNIPLIIGEGPQLKGGCDLIDWPWEYTIAKCQQHEIGWLTWSWGKVVNGDCTATGVYDLTTDGKFGNWKTPFAKSIVLTDPNSIKNTSVKPKSLTKVK